MKTIENQKDATAVRRQEIDVLKVQGEDVWQNGAVDRLHRGEGTLN